MLVVAVVPVGLDYFKPAMASLSRGLSSLVGFPQKSACQKKQQKSNVIMQSTRTLNVKRVHYKYRPNYNLDCHKKMTD